MLHAQEIAGVWISLLTTIHAQEMSPWHIIKSISSRIEVDCFQNFYQHVHCARVTDLNPGDRTRLRRRLVTGGPLVRYPRSFAQKSGPRRCCPLSTSDEL